MAVEVLRRQAADELQQLLQQESSAFPGLDRVRLALESPGKLLSSESGGFAWGLLPLLVIDAAGGQPRTGLPLAAAVDCLITASDVLDDVEDGDSPTGLERVCGIPAAINVATFLVFMGLVGIHRLIDQGVRAEIVCAVTRVIARAAVRACGGQQRDIDQDDGLLSESGYLEMVEAKSGALVEGVCRAAAIVADAAPEAIEAYAQFGRNLGMALQISNDVRAVSTRQEERNDIAVGKRTLPQQSLGEPVDREGAALYASVVADSYVERASLCLKEARAPARSGLRVFLRSMRR